LPTRTPSAWGWDVWEAVSWLWPWSSSCQWAPNLHESASSSCLRSQQVQLADSAGTSTPRLSHFRTALNSSTHSSHYPALSGNHIMPCLACNRGTNPACWQRRSFDDCRCCDGWLYRSHIAVATALGRYRKVSPTCTSGGFDHASLAGQTPKPLQINPYKSCCCCCC